MTACAFIAQAAEQAGFDDDAVFKLQLATDEACTNIIEHAYEGNPQGEIALSYRVEAPFFVIEIRDHGRPFTPAAVTPPTPPQPDNLENLEIGGLGLHFMRQLMDDLAFTFDPVAGNLLTMRKRLPTHA